MSADSTQLRVMIVGERQLMCDALCALVKANGVQVCGTASNQAAAIKLATEEKPSVILLDTDLAPNDGLTLLSQLREVSANSRVLVLMTNQDNEAYARTIRTGAMGVVFKRQPSDVLIKAIHKINEGEVWVDRATMGGVLTEMTRKPDSGADRDQEKIKNLTEREHQVVALIAEGLKNKQIAKRLFISETTVTHHLSSIFSKLEVSDRLELVIFAFGHNLARLPQGPA